MNNATDKLQGQAGILAAESSDEATVSPWLPAELGRNGASQRQQFQELVRQWKEATLLLSWITDKAMHPADQQIIGMGQEALPLLLEELRRDPDHWFWAFQAITGVKPVPAQDGATSPA
jgi:hypothetical protein